jgi:hypothetical protein
MNPKPETRNPPAAGNAKREARKGDRSESCFSVST